MAFLQKNGFSTAIIANKQGVGDLTVASLMFKDSVKKMRAGVILRAKSKSLA